MSTPTSVPTKLTGSLLLDVVTVKTAPGFFSVLSLVLRASGMSIIVAGRSGEAERVAKMSLCFNDFFVLPVEIRVGRLLKFNRAMELLKSGPVIWPDVDFSTWSKELPTVDNIPGLVVLNWAKVVEDGGLKVQGVANA